MAHVVRLSAPRSAHLVPEAERALEAHEVRVRTLYSGISAGTELTQYRGTNPYLVKRWDGENRLFVDGAASQAYPLDGFGYEEVGEVVEVGAGVDAVRTGQLVWGGWGHRSRAVVDAAAVAGRELPPGLEPIHAVFARIGAIALNAVIDADVHVGEVVAVFGLGVPGLIASMLARLNGADVTGVDPLESRRALAARLGAGSTLDASGAAEAVRASTGGRGADAAVEFSGAYAALHEAIRAVAYNGRVVAAGFYQGGAAAVRLGEEFHHNRVEVVSSQISGLSPRVTGRWDRLRLERTVMSLVAAGRLDVGALVSHVVPAPEVAEAFRWLDEDPGRAAQVVLDFRDVP